MRALDGSDVARSSLHLADRIGGGGQGEVYAVQGGELLFKKYRSPSGTEGAALEVLVSFRRRLSPPQRAYLDSVFAWPLCRVVHAGRCIGFLMRRAPARMSWRTPAGSERLLELQYLLRPPKPGFRTVPQPTADQRRRVALACVRAIDWLHGGGIVLGDISAANVLWSHDPEPGVYFLDCDGFHPVGGRPATAQAQTPDWSDPRTPATRAGLDSDAYKTALVVARIITQNPYVTPGPDPCPRSVPGCLDDRQEAAVRYLFRLADGEPGTRPRVRDWFQALSDQGTGPPGGVPLAPRPPGDGLPSDDRRDRRSIDLRAPGG